MPYKSQKIPIMHSEFDRRIKLTDDQREYIRWLREEERLSYNALARQFGVSKRTVIYVCNPDKYEVAKAKSKQRHREGRYKPTKEEWAATVREHRRYKQSLYIKGLIKNEE